MFLYLRLRRYIYPRKKKIGSYINFNVEEWR
jgi:hypothetical protein